MVFVDLLYLMAGVLLAPWLLWRSFRTGRYRRDLSAKLFGVDHFTTDGRPVVWFHGVSVGEIHLLTTVVKAFSQRFPEYRVVLSSTTDTGLTEARAKFGEANVVPFPFDFSWAVRRTLAIVQPRLLVLAESELWPNLLSVCEQRGVPVAVINTRLSARSFRKWNSIRSLAKRWVLPRVRLWAVQSQDYADRLLALGVLPERIQVTGSVKYDGATGARSTPKAQELKVLFGLQAEAPPLIWVAGSTHPPEEQIVLEVLHRLESRVPRFCLILVPRHPDRFQQVAILLENSRVTWAKRSELKTRLAEPPQVILLDSIGELGAVWSLADVGYTGGSLDGVRGGQSMIEPAGYGVPTVFGPHVWNFRDAAQRLVEAGGAIQVRDTVELEQAIGQLLSHSVVRQKMGQAAQALVQAQQGATQRTLDALAPLLATRS